MCCSYISAFDRASFRYPAPNLSRLLHARHQWSKTQYLLGGNQAQEISEKVEILDLFIIIGFLTYRMANRGVQFENVHIITLFQSLNLMTVYHVTDSSFAISKTTRQPT